MLPDLTFIKSNFSALLQDVKTLEDIADVKVKFLGKSGLVTLEAKKIPSLPASEKREFGQRLNELRSFIDQEITKLRKEFAAKELERKLLEEKIDVTLPGRDNARGRIHPLSHTIKLLKTILNREGFQHVDGPEIDSEWYNFSALNIGEHHPARQMADTFYVADSDNLLRTHTSNVQIRYMQDHKPPLKIFSIGRVYRSDYDATHTPMFHQLEALVVNENVSFVDLKACICRILQSFFGIDDLPIRFRNSYFPFTEPSFEVDVKCDRSIKGEIKIGVGDEWLEILGSGMVNKKVFVNTGIDPKSNQGFALGVGIERLAMLKYNIADLRDFYHGDIRWLQNYGF
jgi:phenylalanyl-tRNA synthetase alpha chain